MCKKPMCSKIYGSLVLLLALALSYLVINVSIDGVDQIMKIIKFFDVMIPVLAVGALLKYIFCAGNANKCNKCNCKICNKNNAYGKSFCENGNENIELPKNIKTDVNTTSHSDAL